MINYNIELTVDADYTYTVDAMKQYDSESRTLKIRIKNKDGTYVTDNKNYQYNFRALKPDGNVVYVKATWADNYAVYTLDRQVLTSAGTVMADIEVKNGDRVVLSSQLMAIDVEPSAISADNLKSDSIVNALGGVGAEAITKAKLIAEIADKAKKLGDTLDKIGEVEATRVEAEKKRVSAEETRDSSEKERKKSETERIASETERKSDEKKRVGAETERNTAETGRNTAETERLSSETARDNAEKERIKNENLRKSNESKREKVEAERVTAETARIGAEKERVKTFNTHHDTATVDHVKFENLLKVLKKVESGQLANEVAEQTTKLNALEGRFNTLTQGELDQNLDTIKEISEAIKKGGTEVQGLIEQVGLKLDKTEFLTEKQNLKTYITSALESQKNDISAEMKAKLNNAEFNTALASKVDKTEGKGLSTNDFTTAEKTKLEKLNIPVDTLTSDLPNWPLSAKQGKALALRVAHLEERSSKLGEEIKKYTEDCLKKSDVLYWEYNKSDGMINSSGSDGEMGKTKILSATNMASTNNKIVEMYSGIKGMITNLNELIKAQKNQSDSILMGRFPKGSPPSDESEAIKNGTHGEALERAYNRNHGFGELIESAMNWADTDFKELETFADIIKNPDLFNRFVTEPILISSAIKSNAGFMTLLKSEDGCTYICHNVPACKKLMSNMTFVNEFTKNVKLDDLSSFVRTLFSFVAYRDNGTYTNTMDSVMERVKTPNALVLGYFAYYSTSSTGKATITTNDRTFRIIGGNYKGTISNTSFNTVSDLAKAVNALLTTTSKINRNSDYETPYIRFLYVPVKDYENA